MIDLNGKNILITGGCGFIGSNFIEHIFNNYKHLTVINYDKMGLGSRALYTKDSSLKSFNMDVGVGNHYCFKKIDISDGLMLDLVPPIMIHYVFHFAAESHVDRSIGSPLKFIKNNVLGISKMLEYIRLYQPQAKFINVSTDEVYGHLNLKDPAFTEESNLNPRSPYSASKASADLIAQSYSSTYGLNIVTTRCCNNYGPHQFSEKFIPTVINCLKNNKKIPVYGNGQNIREWIYVDDHNKSILEIAEIGEAGMVYNIGSGVERTNLDLIADIIRLGGFKGGIKDNIGFVEDRKGHDFRYAIESLNYRRGFVLSSYEESLSKTIQHYC